MEAGSWSLVDTTCWEIASDVGSCSLGDSVFKKEFSFDICSSGLDDSFGMGCCANVVRLYHRPQLMSFKRQISTLYCLADDRLLEAVKFLDLGDGAGWELLQAMLNPDFRKRPIAEAVLNHRFMTGAVL